MKSLWVLLVLVSSQLAHADQVAWRTFTGWDHGYTITVDGETSKITFVEHLGEGKDKKPVIREMENAKAMVLYAEALAKLMKGKEAGPEADDGRVIMVTIESGGKTVEKEINEIRSKLQPHHWISNDLTKEVIEKGTKDIAEEFKKETEAYQLQEMMFELKKHFFTGKE